MHGHLMMLLKHVPGLADCPLNDTCLQICFILCFQCSTPESGTAAVAFTVGLLARVK